MHHGTGFSNDRMKMVEEEEKMKKKRKHQI
jgi:hypothetical protein